MVIGHRADKTPAQSAKLVTHASQPKMLRALPLNGQFEAVREMDFATSMQQECTQLTTTTLFRVTIATQALTQSMVMETLSFRVTPKPVKTVLQDITAPLLVWLPKSVHLDNTGLVLDGIQHV